jgi:uncharacterized membrane protein
MKKLLAAFANLGPLIFFYGTNHFWGLKPAIAVSLVYSVGDIAWKLYRRQPIPSLFKFSVATMLVFGSIDLYATTPFLIRYEAVVTNVFTGIFFGLSLRSERTVIEEAAAQSPEQMNPEKRRFFRILTAVWVIYFFAKAGVYVWVAKHYTIEQALLIRSTFGTASLYGLIFISAGLAKPIFLFLKNRGWLAQG